MDSDRLKDEDGSEPVPEAVSWIEAALQAGLGREGAVRPDLAREALREADADGGGDLEHWLESVAIALDAGAGEEVRDAADKIRANRAQSLGAHNGLESGSVGNLIRNS